MIDDHPDLERRYRAPRGFGPSPGPRNIPLSQRDVDDLPDEVTTSVAVSLEAEPEQLTRFLPEGLQVSGAGLLTVTATRFENLRWLAGRGYPVLAVTIPVDHFGDRAEDAVSGSYLAVLWEGLADPIITGRDELGFPKLPADIRTPGAAESLSDGRVEAHASWDGFPFFDLTANVPAGGPDPSRPPAPAPDTIVHRFVPSLESPDRGDIDELVLHPSNASASTVTEVRSGTGRFAFHRARFSDVPVQYPVINALADLSLSETGRATFSRTTARPGGAPPGASGVRRLRRYT